MAAKASGFIYRDPGTVPKFPPKGTLFWYPSTSWLKCPSKGPSQMIQYLPEYQHSRDRLTSYLDYFSATHRPYGRSSYVQSLPVRTLVRLI